MQTGCCWTLTRYGEACFSASQTYTAYSTRIRGASITDSRFLVAVSSNLITFPRSKTQIQTASESLKTSRRSPNPREGGVVAPKPLVDV